MIYGYARVSTDGQSEAAQVRQLRAAGAGPAFRDAFQRRRCLVPLDSFYEWKKTAAGKQPYAIALADRRLMAMAGLWETWRSPAGERVRSFTIVPRPDRRRHRRADRSYSPRDRR
jgi:putative SOS response-associated peptidase YedK